MCNDPKIFRGESTGEFIPLMVKGFMDLYALLSRLTASGRIEYSTS